MPDPVQHARTFFAAHPEIEVLEAFIVDVNGQLRGKWVPASGAERNDAVGLAFTLVS